jgi:hypothetical protein
LTVWVLFATCLLARLALSHPDVGPQIPAPLALWLVKAYGAQNDDEIADLETLLTLAVSFLVITTVTAAAYFALRAVKRAKAEV